MRTLCNIKMNLIKLREQLEDEGYVNVKNIFNKFEKKLVTPVYLYSRRTHCGANCEYCSVSDLYSSQNDSDGYAIFYKLHNDQWVIYEHNNTNGCRQFGDSYLHTSCRRIEQYFDKCNIDICSNLDNCTEIKQLVKNITYHNNKQLPKDLSELSDWEINILPIMILYRNISIVDYIGNKDKVWEEADKSLLYYSCWDELR
jgi:hypothetical protein